MLDNNTVDWYRDRANKEIDRLTKALRKEDLSEEKTRSIRARIAVLEEVARWTWNAPSNDPEIEFGL